MASRDKFKLYRPLLEVWDYGFMRWEMKYPTLPQPFLTATYRSNQEQDQLYNQPRDGKDNDGDGRIDERDEFVTRAKAGQSAHNYFPSFAFDIAFIKDGKVDWSDHLFDKFWALVSEKYNEVITWGGNFKSIKDKPHFEWKEWEDMKGSRIK